MSALLCGTRQEAAAAAIDVSLTNNTSKVYIKRQPMFLIVFRELWPSGGQHQPKLLLEGIHGRVKRTSVAGDWRRVGHDSP